MKLMIIDSDAERIEEIRGIFSNYGFDVMVVPGIASKSKILHSYVRTDPDGVIIGRTNYKDRMLEKAIRTENRTMLQPKHLEVSLASGNQDWRSLAKRWTTIGEAINRKAKYSRGPELPSMEVAYA